MAPFYSARIIYPWCSGWRWSRLRHSARRPRPGHPGLALPKFGQRVLSTPDDLGARPGVPAPSWRVTGPSTAFLPVGVASPITARAGATHAALQQANVRESGGGAAEEDRQVGADELATAVGEDGREVGEARTLLAAAGRGPSDQAALRSDAAEDCGVAGAGGKGAGKETGRRSEGGPRGV